MVRNCRPQIQQKKPTSLKLLILCVLRYLGRGWTIDDLEEVTVINPETIRIFIHRFIEFGSDTLYNKYVKTPATLDEIIDCASEYAMAGLPGSIGSTDATHIVLENCIYRLIYSSGDVLYWRCRNNV